MAKTFRKYLGEPARTVYPVDFNMGYLDKSDIYVYSGENFAVQLAYNWVNDSQIQLTTPFTLGEEFTIRRIVDRTQLVNDYEDGAILRESNLDDSFKQALMILEEIEDGFPTTGGEWAIKIPLILSGNLDANNFKIVNLAEPELPSDAATKGYFDGFVELTTEQAEIATAAAALAVAARNTAEIHRDTAEDYADSARDSALQLEELLDNQGVVLNFPLDLGFITETPVAVSYDLGSL